MKLVCRVIDPSKVSDANGKGKADDAAIAAREAEEMEERLRQELDAQIEAMAFAQDEQRKQVSILVLSGHCSASEDRNPCPLALLHLVCLASHYVFGSRLMPAH